MKYEYSDGNKLLRHVLGAVLEICSHLFPDTFGFDRKLPNQLFDIGFLSRQYVLAYLVTCENRIR